MAKKRGKDNYGPRRNGFDDDFDLDRSRRKDNRRGGGFGGGDFAQPSMGFGPMASGAAAGPVVTATVSWYNSEKGFGFASLANGGGDAFLHASTLEAVQVKSLSPGAVLRCRTGQGTKGPQITEILEIDESKASAPSPRTSAPSAGRDRGPVDPSSAVEVAGQVKWYSAEKGFGFVVTEDGGKDVFVHASALQRSNLQSLEPESRVILKVVDGSKGREAVSVELG
ncbi:MAG: cold shock domain-containing protein [Candidatus Pacebacteria bacterium]|nr:cold shock domain-containing protein [Candidatus Paceibacterota bacterium]